MIRLQCPICERVMEAEPKAEALRFAPFCSARCRQIDLGRWLGERYTVPRERIRADDSTGADPDE